MFNNLFSQKLPGTIVFLMLLLSSLFCNDASLMVAIDDFKNPPSEYRITQYGLDAKTLVQYPEYGLGDFLAFFYDTIYPKPGKEISKEGVIAELVEKALAQGRKVWLADDFGYPSGMAGGKTVEQNPELVNKSLAMVTLTGNGAVNFSLPDDLTEIVTAVLYPASTSETEYTKGQILQPEGRIIRSGGVDGGWKLCVFALHVRDKDTQAQSTMKQFGHSGKYPDVMNPRSTELFLKNMHEKILAQIKDPANQVQGFYANEPNLMQTHWKPNPDAPYAFAPWTPALPARFKKMHGYDITPFLPALFEGDSLDARRVRLHYRQTVNTIYTESFADQIRKWCNDRGIKSSGHFLLNEYLAQHVQGYGDMMRFVSHFDVAALDIGIPEPKDWETFPYEQTRMFSSVASWKKNGTVIQLLDPIIGAGTGVSRLCPGIPLLRNAANQGFLHGANLYNSYLPLTHRSAAAPGYNPAEFTAFNEYVGRIARILRGAKRGANVALYYPIAMFQSDLLASAKMWQQINDQPAVAARQKEWSAIEHLLLAADVEYMIVHPEGVLESSITNGRLEIGWGSYEYLIMPRMDMFPLQVAQKVKDFIEGGGKVLWVDTVPSLGEYPKEDGAVNELLKSQNSTPLAKMIRSIETPYHNEFDLLFTLPKKLSSKSLQIGRFYKVNQPVYYLVNRTAEELKIKLGTRRTPGSGEIKVLDPLTGEIKSATANSEIAISGGSSLLLIPGVEFLSGKIDPKKKIPVINVKLPESKEETGLGEGRVSGMKNIALNAKPTASHTDDRYKVTALNDGEKIVTSWSHWAIPPTLKLAGTSVSAGLPATGKSKNTDTNRAPDFLVDPRFTGGSGLTVKDPDESVWAQINFSEPVSAKFLRLYFFKEYEMQNYQIWIKGKSADWKLMNTVANNAKTEVEHTIKKSLSKEIIAIRVQILVGSVKQPDVARIVEIEVY